MTRTHAYWICQLVGWGLYGVATVAVIGLNVGLTSELVINSSLSVLLGIGVTHAFRSFAHRAGWTSLPLAQLVPRALGACFVLAVVYAGLGDLMVLAGLREPITAEGAEYWTVAHRALAMFGSVVIMLPWVSIYFGVHYFWNYRQAEIDNWKLEARAEAARLKALKLQLNPHFFFNSLNSVRALIAKNPDRAQRMVTRLARLLRTTLQVDDVKTVPLAEELSTVRTYLELEKVRFEERLQYEIDATDAARDRPVPFLLVQTLVENAIKHGIAERQGGGTVGIRAEVEDGTLCLRVTNPGVLEDESGGTGLSNARERLALLFGDEAALEVKNSGPDTVAATARLPARTATTATPPSVAA